LALELLVKSPCLHLLFHPLSPLSSGICKVRICFKISVLNVGT
jgi:hypothetical protein